MEEKMILKKKVHPVKVLDHFFQTNNYYLALLRNLYDQVALFEWHRGQVSGWAVVLSYDSFTAQHIRVVLAIPRNGDVPFFDHAL